MIRFGGSAALCISLLCESGCSTDKSESHKISRNTDTAAVVVVGAEEVDTGLDSEKEPNNSITESSQALLLNADQKSPSGYQGRLNGHKDVDVFTLQSKVEGSVFLRLKGAHDADLRLQLLGPDGEKLAYSDRGPAKTEEGIGGFWLDAETSYQLVVSEFTKRKLLKAKKGRQGESAPYLLTAELRTADSDYEVEPNAGLEGAMEVVLDEKRYGYIGWKNDADLWRLPTVTNEGEPLSLHLNVSGIAGVNTSLAILDADAKKLLEVHSSRGNETAIGNFVPAPDAEFYLVRIRSKGSNPELPYTLRVTSADRPVGREAEPNNEIATATVLPGTGGSLILGSGELSRGDRDTFQLTASPENRVLEVRLEGRSGVDFTLAVLAESGATLATSADAPKGILEVVKQVNVPAGSSPRIRIAAKSLSVPTEYTFSLTLASGQAPAMHPSQVVVPPLGETVVDPSTTSPSSE